MVLSYVNEMGQITPLVEEVITLYSLHSPRDLEKDITALQAIAECREEEAEFSGKEGLEGYIIGTPHAAKRAEMWYHILKAAQIRISGSTSFENLSQARRAQRELNQLIDS